MSFTRILKFLKDYGPAIVKAVGIVKTVRDDNKKDK